MNVVKNLPMQRTVTALAPKQNNVTTLVGQAAQKIPGGYGKLAAALVGLGVIGAATYLACKNSGNAESAN